MSGQRIRHPAFNLSRRLKSAAGNRDKEQAPHAAPLVKYPGRQREESLAHEIERMHLFQAQLIQTSSDGIIANDQRGRIIIFNQGAETILGYRMEEVIGKIPVQKLFPPGGARFIKKGIYSPEHGGSGRLVHYETQVLSKTGELVR